MAIVKKYPAEVIHIQNKVAGIYTIELKSLTGPFKYQPGQFLHLALDEHDPSGQWPASRCFSMQSSPDEELIKITYAVKGQFTSRMQQELKTGSEVTLKLPYGDIFTQTHNKENTIFIAGGTGITPFLSLYNHSSFTGYSSPVLYAGFRSQSMNLYQSELEMAKAVNPSFKIVHVYQETEGVLDISLINKNSHPDSSYFISGPPLMIKKFKHQLIAFGVSRSQVLTDDWE